MHRPESLLTDQALFCAVYIYDGVPFCILWLIAIFLSSLPLML